MILLQYHRKLILLHFEIEPFEFTRFKYPFTTDKYLNVLQNEELYSKINDVLREVTKQQDWRKCKLQGKLKVSDVFVEYNIVERSNSPIDFEKVEYEYDWIMKIEINRRPKKSDNSSPKSSLVDIEDDFIKVVNSDTPSVLSDVSITIQLSDTIDENQANIIKLEDSQNFDQENEDFVTYRQNKRPKLDHSTKDHKSKKKGGDKNKGQQKFMDTWLNSSGEVSNNLNHSKASKRKETSSSSMILRTGDNVIADIMDQEKRNQFQTFLEKSKEQEFKLEIRKQELKDYQLIDCKHLTKEDIKM